MATARRFVFTERTKTGSERLLLANLDLIRPARPVTARIWAHMGTVPGELPTEGIPETYQEIAVRPDNAYAAVWSAQVGFDFVDWNIAIYDMDTGLKTVRFNEHSVNQVNRANCPCPLFDAFLASEAAMGVPQSQLDSYDYSVVSEGTGVGQPTLVWSVNGTLIATYRFEVTVDNAASIGEDNFAFEVAPTSPSGNDVTVLSRNAGIAPYSPIPANPFSTRHLSSRFAPVDPPVIHYGKYPVKFYPRLWKFLPSWLASPLFGTGYRSAKRVQGFLS